MGYCKHIVVTLLLFCYVLSATSFAELGKLPKLAEHYFDHLRENNCNGVFNYLVQHYTKEDGTDKDASEDRKLPFQSTEYTSITTFVSTRPPAINQVVRMPETVIMNAYTISNDDWLTSPFIHTIFQPPRFC